MTEKMCSGQFASGSHPRVTEEAPTHSHVVDAARKLQQLQIHHDSDEVDAENPRLGVPSIRPESRHSTSSSSRNDVRTVGSESPFLDGSGESLSVGAHKLGHDGRLATMTDACRTLLEVCKGGSYFSSRDGASSISLLTGLHKRCHRCI